jgi:hypothetical protein
MLCKIIEACSRSQQFAVCFDQWVVRSRWVDDISMIAWIFSDFTIYGKTLRILYQCFLLLLIIIYHDL